MTTFKFVLNSILIAFISAATLACVDSDIADRDSNISFTHNEYIISKSYIERSSNGYYIYMDMENISKDKLDILTDTLPWSETSDSLIWYGYLLCDQNNLDPVFSVSHTFGDITEINSREIISGKLAISSLLEKSTARTIDNEIDRCGVVLLWSSILIDTNKNRYLVGGVVAAGPLANDHSDS